jgi:hypothetical protein
LSCIALTAIVATGAVRVFAVAQTTAPSPGNPVAAFLGHWQGGGTFFYTKLSKAGKVESKGDCKWSPQKRYMICEHTITDSRGTRGQLTVFAAKVKPDEVRYATLNDADAPSSGIAFVHDNVWTFSSENTRDGVTTTIRTTNTFESDKELFRVEYSEDHGAH